MSQYNTRRLRVRNGFLTTGPTMTFDARARARDEEEDPDEMIEIRNHMPSAMEPEVQDTAKARADARRRLRDQDPNEGENEDPDSLIASYPAGHTAISMPDGGIEIHRVEDYGSSPSHKTDIYDMPGTSPARDRRGAQVPRTLAELNNYNSNYYRQMGGRR